MTGRPGRDRIGFALSVGGFVFAAAIVAIALPIVGWTGDVDRIWDPIGDAFRAGQPVYVAKDYAAFLYAPPWAVLFGVTSLLPIPIQVALVWAANLAALRYMAGGWLAVGWLGWFPLVPLSLVGATFNLAMAGVIVAAVRGAVGLPVLFAFAKGSPILAVDPRQWRRVLVVGTLLVAVTVPWLSLWPAWTAQLTAHFGHPDPIELPVSLVFRAPIALGLLLLRRPWARALAAVVAIPAFYTESFAILLAPLCVWLRSRGAQPRVKADTGRTVLDPTGS